MKEQLLSTDAKLNQNVLPKLKQFNFRISRLVKKLRQRRMYFFDTMLLKSSKHTRGMVSEGKQLDGSLNDALSQLDEAMSKKTGDWRLKYAIKRIRKDCFIEKSEDFEKKTGKQLTEMDSILNELVSEYQL